MKLYHHTAVEYLSSIARGGLWKGEVAVTASDLLNAVWLTTAAEAGAGSDHGLTDGRPLTAAEKLFLGLPPDAPNRHRDKRAVRFTVLVPRGDRRLVGWNSWARKRLDGKWLAALEGCGGGPAMARTWFLYWGTIPPRWITEVRLRGGDGASAWAEARAAAALLDSRERTDFPP